MAVRLAASRASPASQGSTSTRIEPARSFSEFALFVAFFPQLVAGPIVRASEFLPQLIRRPRLDPAAIGTGLAMILAGLVKKMVIADSIRHRIVDPFFAAPEQYGLIEVVASLCIDEDRVFATGSSNGGTFVHELGYDARASGLFAGIFPMIGSAHNGFVMPVAAGAVPFMGVWGAYDTTMPPYANPEVPGHSGAADTALDTSYYGWYFSTARNITTAWAASAGCTSGPSAAYLTSGGVPCVG